MQTSRKTWLFRLLAVLIAAGLTIGVLEGIGSIGLHVLKELPQAPPEVLAQMQGFDQSVRTAPDPYLMYRIAPDVKSEVTETNRFGLRNGPIQEVPEENTFRVLLLGGSVAWGFTARTNADTLAPLLEKYLAEEGKDCERLFDRKIEVLNAGAPSYVCWQEALLYSTRHHELESDLVVSLSGTNEPYAAIRTREPGAPARYDSSRRYASPKPTLGKGLSEWFGYRLSRLKIVRYLRERTPATVADFDPPDPSEVATAYGRALEHLAVACEGRKATFMAFLQPMALFPDKKTLAPYERESAAHYEGRMPGRSQYYKDCFDAFRGKYQELALAWPGVGLNDATSVFQEEPGITYTDHCHLTPLGRELLARHMAKTIVQHLERLGRADKDSLQKARDVVGGK